MCVRPIISALSPPFPPPPPLGLNGSGKTTLLRRVLVDASLDVRHVRTVTFFKRTANLNSSPLSPLFSR